MIVLFAIDAREAWHSPQRYPFGAEGPVASLWAYASQRHYLIASGLALAACGLAMIGIWWRHAPRLVRWLCVAPLLAVVVHTFLEWIVAFE
ncbi:hypothetical protein [Cupriavidus laharis]|nr:hypothetical protein [Cupriavidus laharis]